VASFDNYSKRAIAEDTIDVLTQSIAGSPTRNRNLSIIVGGPAAGPLTLAGDVRRQGDTSETSFIVSGHMQKAGDSIHISVQLVRAAYGRLAWTQRFHLASDTVETRLDAIAETIALELRPQILAAAKRALKRLP
jgi:TolB-like protein